MDPDREQDLDEEFRSHLEIQTQENIERGMTPEEARYAALRKFGGMALAKETCREAWGFLWLDRLKQDLRYAIRMFRRSPGFTMAAVLSLALGIGATTAVFSVLDAVLLKPLPYREPARIVGLSLRNEKLMPGFGDLPVSAPLLEYWRRSCRTLEQIAAWQPVYFNLSGGQRPERIHGVRVTPNLFGLLGAVPQFGTVFGSQEDQPGRDHVLVLSNAFWRRRFGADASVLGRKLLLNGDPYTIIGVMPPGFEYPRVGESIAAFGADPTDFWKPMAFTEAERADTGDLSHMAIGRLRPGASVAAARAEVVARSNDFLRQAPAEFQLGWQVSVDALEQKVSSGVRSAVLALFGAVTLLLAIASVNIANLLLARAARRREEIAVRRALGADRGRLLRQLLSETLLLALGGGVMGSALAAAAIRAFVASAPAGIPRLDEVRIDWRVLVFSAGISIATGLLFGLAPAWESLRKSVAETLRSGGSRSGVGFPRRTRQILVAAEVALAFVLLAGAGLLAKSLTLLLRAPAGFRAENALTFELPLTSEKYRDPAACQRLLRDLLRNCRQLPGVTAAGVTDVLPLTGEINIGDVGVEGAAREGSNVPVADFRAVTPQYFSALGVKRLEGRWFAEQEQTPVAIISRTAARQFWPGERNVVGRRFKRGIGGTAPWRTVVGVVEDVRSSALDVMPRPQVYSPLEGVGGISITVILRSLGEPPSLAAAVRSEVAKLDKDQPVMRLRWMKQVVGASVAGRRFQTWLLCLFSAFALGLAAVGIYGVVAYSAAQRTHEIGLRMALGAGRWDAVGLVLRDGMAPAAVGAALGAAAALGATRMLASLLYGVTTTDPAVFAGVAAVMLGIAFAACYIPARRAAKTDPLIALRYE